MDMEKWQTRRSEEYQNYMKALCRLASTWVPKIRIQFAQKAYEMFQNETVRKLVLAYGEEVQKLDASRLDDFCRADENFDCDFFEKYEVDADTYLEDSCLVYAKQYAQSIYYLFDIKWGKE